MPSHDALLVHRCTVTPTTAGTEDAHGGFPRAAGSPVTAVPCWYQTLSTLVTDEGGQRTVSVPTMFFGPAAAVAVGSRITAVAASDGTVLEPGPLVVETADPLTMLGPPVLRRVTARRGDPR